MNRFLALLAFIIFTIFVGILLWKVPEPDLVIIGLLTIALVAYDFVTSSGNGTRG